MPRLMLKKNDLIIGYIIYNKMITDAIFEHGYIQQYVDLTIKELDEIPTRAFHKNLETYVANKINKEIGGKCRDEGYIKPNSIEVTSMSVGEVQRFNIRYDVVIRCLISCPVEGMIIKCVAQTITNGGIKSVVAEYPNDSPMVIFIAKELSVESAKNISENDEFLAKIIGVQYEIGDPYVSVIAKIFVE